MSPLALVSGATGYIGGRLIPELLADGFRVRVLARRPRNLADRGWHDQVQIVQGDAADAKSLSQALRDVDVAYYLIHSLGTGAGFEALDPGMRGTSPPQLVPARSAGSSIWGACIRKPRS